MESKILKLLFCLRRLESRVETRNLDFGMKNSNFAENLNHVLKTKSINM